MQMSRFWLLLLSVVLVSACAGPIKVARRGASAGATGLYLLDGPASEGYDAAHERALAENETREGYDEDMASWNDLETGMRAAHAAFFAFDAALDAAEAGDDDDWLGLGACALSAARRLVELAQAVGLELPPELAQAIDTVGTLALAACPNENPSTTR